MRRALRGPADRRALCGAAGSGGGARGRVEWGSAERRLPWVASADAGTMEPAA